MAAPKLALEYHITLDDDLKSLTERFMFFKFHRFIFVEFIMIDSLVDQAKFVSMYNFINKGLRLGCNIDFTIATIDPLFNATPDQRYFMGQFESMGKSIIPVHELSIMPDESALKYSIDEIDHVVMPDGLKRGLKRVIDDYARSVNKPIEPIDVN